MSMFVALESGQSLTVTLSPKQLTNFQPLASQTLTNTAILFNYLEP